LATVVWVASTWRGAVYSRTPTWFYPVKLDGRLYPDLPEFDEFFLLQCERDYGLL
jgi:hypothetical protein